MKARSKSLPFSSLQARPRIRYFLSLTEQGKTEKRMPVSIFRASRNYVWIFTKHLKLKNLRQQQVGPDFFVYRNV